MKLSPLALLGVLVAAAPAAFASSSAELTVKGTIKPGACTPSLGTGNVDFGTIAANTLNPDAHTALPVKNLNLSVACDANTRFALFSKDNQEGSATSPSDGSLRSEGRAHGLGWSTGEEPKKIGHYLVEIDPAQTTVDGSTGYASASTDGGETWGSAGSASYISPSELLGFSPESGHNEGPAPVKDLISVLNIKAHLAPSNELDLSADLTLNGSAVIELQYL
ncbi:DUF1120 domain-containing protein [Pseudomonas sp. B21-032]|uniref:DUF1120 domain-containing protein n=1 Tax=Pseudomonas sp. B21-032 TaxID=2895483 RepID=UPI00216090ED|nr:DUF1120 domain-containing protein [Pseudomonas sp. B21-032]UVL62789.1 DUF1120 domain-containing protein [Pseudomonas sp. B21-032]